MPTSAIGLPCRFGLAAPAWAIAIPALYSADQGSRHPSGRGSVWLTEQDRRQVSKTFRKFPVRLTLVGRRAGLPSPTSGGLARMCSPAPSPTSGAVLHLARRLWTGRLAVCLG